MTARILDGKAVAAQVRADVARAVEAMGREDVRPGLAVILVGDDPASALYVRNKQRACAETGIRTFDHNLGAQTPEPALLDLVERLNGFDDVDGILVQLPLPRHIDASRVLSAVDPNKDVDGFHPENVGLLALGRPRYVPCTPGGVLRLLGVAGVALEGAEAVVVGRSTTVGRPIATLLTHANATVTVCHSRTRDLGAAVARADVVVAAAGRAGIVRGEWIKPGATVIDVGINRGADGRLTGDVEFAAAAERAAALTPVPGGVGPMTVAMLLANTIRAARLRRSEPT